jgi:hypothetical protein
MNPRAEQDSGFLSAGVRHFPDAHAAVNAFRRVITETVESVLQRSRPDVWKPAAIKLTRSEGNGLWVGAGGPMALAGLSDKSLVIDVGIWWNASHFQQPRVAVAALYGAADVVGRRLDVSAQGHGADVGLVRSGSRADFFVLPLGDDVTDVGWALQAVVDTAASAVGVAVSSSPNRLQASS